MKDLRKQNDLLNDKNFKLRRKIKSLKKRIPYLESIAMIWKFKDKIKDMERKILLNEQQVRFNLINLTMEK